MRLAARYCACLKLAPNQVVPIRWRRNLPRHPSMSLETNGDPAMLTGYFQIQEAELKRKAVTDPRAAVAVDVALLRAIPALPGEWLISGLIYDVATGLVDVVVPPARIR
jgi:hypothetical protein